MNPPASPASQPDPALPPHADPAHWGELIQEVGPGACLVVIASSMSERLKVHVSPEDIWQETLANAWRARDRHQWQGVASYRAWLFKIARNRIRDAARKLGAEKRGGGARGMRLSEFAGAESRDPGEQLPPDSVTPSRILQHAERAAAMEKSLAGLPPELEPVVRMHLLEDLTMEVVAERLGIGVSTAWRRYRKGAEMYSKALAEWEREGDRR